jgi:anti-sigma regulatory factor (Ser/Thr protein kinase)
VNDTAVGLAHEAFFYRGDAGFLDGTLGFVRGGLANGERVFVATEAPKIELLRDALGDHEDLLYGDMTVLGRNPALIIPFWRRFLDSHLARGRPVRGVGEPVWSGRRAAEIAECQVHECLLNVAFATDPSWRLLCPYDAASLADPVIEAARASHPVVMEAGIRRASPAWVGDAIVVEALAGPLPEPLSVAECLGFDVLAHAGALRLGVDRADDLSLAVHEVATNSVRHGGGAGTLRIWRDPAALICEVRDQGRIRDVLVGRSIPDSDGEGGRGLWMANQLCDLVQVRSTDQATVVRMHVWL